MTWYAPLLDLLYPRDCPVCRVSLTEAAPICSDCREKVIEPEAPNCRRCGTATAHEEPSCGHCLGESHMPDAVYFAFSHREPLAQMLYSFKYQDRPGLSQVLGPLLVEKVSGRLQGETLEAVLPVPLHWWRLVRRRYNQSALLADHLSKSLSLPLETHTLKRIRRTRQQVGLSRGERLENMDGAFLAQGVMGRSLLLVDDVFTTGATLHAAAKALKMAGAKRVVGVCLARAEKNMPRDIAQAATR